MPYRRAVEGATAAGFPGDVAEALYAIMMVRDIYGSIDEVSEIGEINEIAMAVRGTRTRLGARHSPRDHALAYLLQGSMPEAHLRLRRYLWEARLSGHFRAEREAHELLGDLYEKSDETDMAMEHRLLAGNAKEAAALAGRLSAPIDLRANLSHSAPWVQAAALAAIAKESKTLPSDHVVALVPTLLSLTGGAIQGLLGPQVDINAIEALAALSLQVPEDRVNDLIAVLEPLIAPPKGRYHFADDAMVDGLVDLYCGHPEARERVGALLVRCLGEPRIAKRATSRLHGIIPLGQDLVERLRGLALSNRHAAELLAASGDTTPEVLSAGEHRVAAVLSQQPREAHGTVTVGGVDGMASVFARLLSSERQEALARHWVRHASNTEDLEINRAQAVEGIGILARNLRRDLRSELFDAIFPLADPNVAVSAADEMHRQSMHPLSRFRIDFGAGWLPRAAAQTCASLATTSQQAKIVADMALVWLRSSSPDDLRAAALVIRAIDPKLITFDVLALASHPSVEVRRTAVILWARDVNRDASLSKVFASDRGFRVRLELAAAAKTVAGYDRELATKLRNSLANDPHAWVRWHAVRGPQESIGG